ncbi:MAG: dihydropteroate synthase [Haemophilus parainfluenzae]|jgi:dihydropteroate synthase|uniref:dihydropteroate synthase n=1 Tax=uncultured Haemophilus sp. TaxID=237779 RepID=UPI002805B123|nr:dihydropteroate synthase [uncultured Haemophilus sp.]MDU4566586.1 dihydropteroate synthase [Haemophilus parainfluenzae]MDU4638463.1 dihydropteroate synthase [Haemophilus parainfluenzae]MDU5010085.1 dihydropteroate synthase [Haemophilus parainfluenzae]MDU5991311.1 dihydropteroate synthase [Haemophilus parainfluenzae]MDU7970084.1 dihydropteroate synthase [Haemophilus parainfluenzae]
MKLYANNKCLDLSFPQIMGILNFTPDSFSDSGQFFSLDKALFQVEKMLKEGATIIDIGGESTRPMAEEVSEAEELQRVIPLVEAVQKRFDCWISVDTSKAIVMQEAAKVGMDLINDIRALREPGALEIAGQLNLPTCIMHMQGQPRTMQTNPHYDDVVQDVYQFLETRTQACLEAGIVKENIIWDMGFGFGKTVQHNYKLLQQLAQFCKSGYPILAGLSRKSMIGAVLDKPVTERVVGSVAGALIAAQNGATILRVHDVAATTDALKVWQATREA